MPKKTTACVLLALLLLIMVGGCSFPVFQDVVTVSTKPIQSTTKLMDGERVSGRSCSRMTLLIIPLGFGYADAAFEEALGKQPGADTIVDFRLRADFLSIIGTLIYFQSCIEVDGVAVNAQEALASSEDPEATRAALSYWRDRRQEISSAANEQQALAIAEQHGLGAETPAR